VDQSLIGKITVTENTKFPTTHKFLEEITWSKFVPSSLHAVTLGLLFLLLTF